MEKISQTFGTVRVLNEVDLTVEPGEVHALVGQNGAGKSTLMKILGGLYPDHKGLIEIDGLPARLTNPRSALKHGIGMIYQELSLIPSLSVAENILLGIEPGRGGYNRRGILSAARSIVKRVPMLSELPLNAPAGDLSTGLQQRVEVAKALARDARVLVMDEPTARLSGPEREDLGDLIRELSANGISIIYISHFLEEIFQYCSSLTVLRNGTVVDRGRTVDFTLGSLTRSMLGAELADEEFDPANSGRPPFTGVPVIELTAVSGPRISGIDIAIHGGEIIGLAGLVGSGRTRVARTFTGAEPLSAGTISISGRRTTVASPRQALKMGIVMLPENRKTEGLIGISSAQENLILNALDRGLTRFGVIRSKAALSESNRHFTELEIRPNMPSLAAERFSGGNQQKILLARALLAKPRVLIIDQPTAGVDVGTKAQIHVLIRRVASQGTAVLIVTDDLEEMLALADNVLVLRSGRIVSRHRRVGLDRKRLVAAISGEDGVSPLSVHPA